MTRRLCDPLQERETERAFVLEFMLFVVASLLALALCAFWGGPPSDNDNDSPPEKSPKPSTPTMPTTTKKNP